MLAGLVRAPSRLDPSTEAVQEERDGATVYVVPATAQAIVVRDFVLAQMLSRTSSPRQQYDEAIAEEIVLAPPAEQRVPGAALRVRRATRGERAARGRGPARHRRSDASTPPSTTGATSASREKWARIGYDMDRLSDERAGREVRRGSAGLDQAAPGPQHQQRRHRDGQLPHRRRARVRRVRRRSTARRRRSTSRTSTSSARPTASPGPPSSRSRTPRASRPASSARPRCSWTSGPTSPTASIRPTPTTASAARSACGTPSSTR